MPKVKYYFNTHSLKYERVVVSVWKYVFRVFGFLAAAVVFAAVIIAFAYRFLDSPKEKQLKRELAQLQLQYELINNRIDTIATVIGDLENRDDQIYRVVFEAEPIPKEVRNAGFGGTNRYRDLQEYDNARLMVETTQKLDKLSKRLYVQSKSYDEIFKMAKNKSQMLASIPAIQPVSNKKLQHVASGYGFRIHPIYKTWKMHTGIDFTAPSGTDVYATGNGVVVSVEIENRGYGHAVTINHGYGYQTLYAHLSKISVRPGQKVKRGDVVGKVGSTGTSTAPHLHYEVLKGGKKVNPINFFFNDLSPAEYDKMLEISSQVNQSFD